MFEGQLTITGFWLSVTVTVKLHWAVLLVASVTVRLIVVIPTLRVLVPICPLPPNIVAPVVDHVKTEPLQLSVKITSGISTLALH